MESRGGSHTFVRKATENNGQLQHTLSNTHAHAVAHEHTHTHTHTHTQALKHTITHTAHVTETGFYCKCNE